MPDRASVDTTAENKRFESFVDIVAQVFGKNKENTAIRFESKAQVSQYVSSVGLTKKKDLGRHPHAPPRLGVVSQERYVRNETATDPSAVSIAGEEEAVKDDFGWMDTYRGEEEFDPEDGREAVSERTRAEVKDLGARYGRKVRFENLPAGRSEKTDCSHCFGNKTNEKCCCDPFSKRQKWKPGFKCSECGCYGRP